MENQTKEQETKLIPKIDIFDGEHLMWDIICGLICIPTILGNSLILLSVLNYSVRSSIHTLIANLAVSDLIVGAILLPVCIVTDLADLDANKYVCLTKASILVLSIGGTCYGLLLVSVDRFIAICYPLQYVNAFTKRRLIFILASGWSYVALFAIFPLTGWNYYDRNLPYNCGTDEVFTPIYQKFITGNFIFVLFLNFTLYIIVIKKAIQKSSQIYTQEICFSSGRNNRDIYRVKTMAIVQGLFLVCWLPYFLASVVVSFNHDTTSRKVQYWALLVGIMNSTFNWIIYGYRKKQLRERMKSYVFKMCCISS